MPSKLKQKPSLSENRCEKNDVLLENTELSLKNEDIFEILTEMSAHMNNNTDYIRSQALKFFINPDEKLLLIVNKNLCGLQLPSCRMLILPPGLIGSKT